MDGDRENTESDRSRRTNFLITALWGVGLLATLGKGAAADYPWWSWINLRFITSIIVMFLMGSAAFTATKEGAGKYRRVGLISLPIGATAALSIGDWFAAFIIFLLAGFVLDWWGTARASN